jgi:hypothetical protein
MRRKLTALSITATATIALLSFVQSSSAQTRIYRGSIGNSHIQMQLNFAGRNVTGTYAYDTVGEDLRLNGALDEQGRLELTELAPKGKQKTGKFVCKRFNDALDAECSWSRPDGTRESLVVLEEQYFSLKEGLQITPKTIVNRRTGVGVSYPQITSNGPLSAGAQAFNRRILSLAQKAIGDFQPIDGRGTFDTNYNVLLGTNDLISVELSIYYDGGGAHPNNYFLSLTYDLKTGKELQFEDLFQPGTDYNSAIANYLVTDIDKRAAALEQRYQTQPQPAAKREEPVIAADQLTELSGWGLTPKGLVVYFDFPHVIAAFDKNIVPYSVVKAYFKPDSPAAKFQ